MTEKHKKDLPNKRISKQNNGYGVVILLLIGIISLGSYLAFESNPNILDDIFPKSEKIEPTKEPVTDEAAAHENKEQEEVVKIVSDEQAKADFPADDSQALSPYDLDAENNNVTTHVMPEESPINNIKDYRIYLANANELLMKFSKDIDYSENLLVIKEFDLPKDIQEIVVMFEEYNNMIKTKDSGSEKVSVFNSDIFDRFLKVQKETPLQSEMKKLKTKIESKSQSFSEYIFSADMQEAFLK